MTVARAAQDEVEVVRREMQEKVKAAQDAADRQVRVRRMFVTVPNSFPFAAFEPTGPADF